MPQSTEKTLEQILLEIQTNRLLPSDLLIDTDNELHFVKIEATADGSNVLIEAVASKYIRVVSYAFTVTQPALVEFRDADGTTLAKFDLSAQGGVAFAGQPWAPAFETLNQGVAVSLVLPAGVDAFGHLSYILRS